MSAWMLKSLPAVTSTVFVQGSCPAFLIVIWCVPGATLRADLVLPMYFPSISISAMVGAEVIVTAACSGGFAGSFSGLASGAVLPLEDLGGAGADLVVAPE